MLKNNKKNRKNFLFRTYGGKVKNKQTGLGHVVRSINLATKLKKFGDIYFLIEDYGGGKNVILKNNFKKIYTLKKNISIDEDIFSTNQFLMKKNIDVIIIDKFKTNSKYLKNLSEHVKKIIISSDSNKTNYPADLIINSFIGLENKKFKNKYGGTCLNGPKYHILNERFKKKIKKNPQFDVLATFGGMDECGISKIFLDILLNKYNNLKCKIILGPISLNSNYKNQDRKNSTNITIIKSTNSMYSEIINARFGFTTGGNTSYEFASLQKPFAIICDDNHQLKTAKKWSEKKIAYNLGMINSNSFKKIQKVLDKISDEQFKNDLKNYSYVDGFGSERVSKEILKIL